jgi:hypothetical protein
MVYSPLTMNEKRRSRSEHWRPTLLLLAAVVPLYLAFRSISLDDFDAYSFALALDHFNLDLQQPQPPGFPIYVLVGRILASVTDPTTALTLLGVLGGTITALAIAALGRVLENGPQGRLTGPGAALLVALAPMGWLTAEKALSDAPGLALTVLAIWLLWRRRDDVPGLSLGSFVAGLGMGLRPQNGLPVLLLLAVLVVRVGWHRRSTRPLLWTILAFAGGLLLWLVPTLVAVGGLRDYLDHLLAHSAHVGQADSLFGGGAVGPGLRGRLIAFADTALLHTIGVSTYSAWGWREVARVAVAAAVVLPGLARADWRRRETWLLAAWAVLAGGQVFLFEALDRPRLMLPALPPLALLVSAGWARVERPRALAPAVLTGAAFALLLQGLPLAATLASVPSPPAQAAAYVAGRYPAEETIVAAAGSFRAVQVELPDYRLLYLYRFDADAARSATAANGVRFAAIFDRDKFPDDAVAALAGDGRYVTLDDRTFDRDARVHTQHDQVRLQVLTPADLLPPESLTPPQGGCIDIGGQEDGRYLDRGWYRPETIGDVGGRWAGGTLTSTLRVALEPGRDVALSFLAMAYPSDQHLTIQVNGTRVVQTPLGSGWTEINVTIPANLLSGEGVTQIDLVHSEIASPFDVTGGGSSDRRTLTAAYDQVCFR